MDSPQPPTPPRPGPGGPRLARANSTTATTTARASPPRSRRIIPLLMFDKRASTAASASPLRHPRCRSWTLHTLSSRTARCCARLGGSMMNIMLEGVATADTRRQSEEVGRGRGRGRPPEGRSVISRVGRAGIEDRGVVTTGTGLPCRVRGDFASRLSSSCIYLQVWLLGSWSQGSGPVVGGSGRVIHNTELGVCFSSSGGWR